MLSIRITFLTLLLFLSVHSEFNGIFTHLSAPDDGADAARIFDANPYLAGITVKKGWKNLQPSPDNIDLSSLYSIITEAGVRGKQVHVAIIPGFTSPSWIFDAPYNVPFLNDVNVAGTVGDAPIPWDSTYVALFTRFVDTLSVMISSHPHSASVIAVEIMGHNYRGEEMHAPSATIFSGQGFEVTYDKVMDNWKYWIDLFNDKFPQKKAILVISQTYSGNGSDGVSLSTVLNDIISYFVNVFDVNKRAILQTDQLDGRQNSVNGVTNKICINYNSSAYTGENGIPNGHEMVGNFYTQPFRQGRPCMTVYNFIAMLNPSYMQLWSGNASDPHWARELLKWWYISRFKTAAEVKSALDTMDLFIENGTYNRQNNAPEANDMVVATVNDLAVNIELKYTDPATPFPSESAHFQILRQPRYGILDPIVVVGGKATIRYTPTMENVIDSFRWTASDGVNTSNFGIVSVEVGTVPHDPYFNADPLQSPTIPNGSVGILYSGVSIAPFAHDVDSGDSLVFSLDREQVDPWLTVSPDGSLFGTPSVEDMGTNKFVVQVVDKSGRCAYSTIIIHVDNNHTGFSTESPQPNLSSPQLIAYPNPFSLRSAITFTARHNKLGKVDIYDIRGKIVYSLSNSNKEWNGTNFNGEPLSPGVFIVRATNSVNGQISKPIKVVLIQ
jgi:hypothetical protein